METKKSVLICGKKIIEILLGGLLRRTSSQKRKLTRVAKGNNINRFCDFCVSVANSLWQKISVTKNKQH